MLHESYSYTPFDNMMPLWSRTGLRARSQRQRFRRRPWPGTADRLAVALTRLTDRPRKHAARREAVTGHTLNAQ